jgi:hypothetical protein
VSRQAAGVPGGAANAMPRRRCQAVGDCGQRLARRGPRQAGTHEIRDRHDVGGDAEPLERRTKLRDCPIGGGPGEGLDADAILI